MIQHTGEMKSLSNAEMAEIAKWDERGYQIKATSTWWSVYSPSNKLGFRAQGRVHTEKGTRRKDRFRFHLKAAIECASVHAVTHRMSAKDDDGPLGPTGKPGVKAAALFGHKVMKSKLEADMYLAKIEAYKAQLEAQMTIAKIVNPPMKPDV